MTPHASRSSFCPLLSSSPLMLSTDEATRSMTEGADGGVTSAKFLGALRDVETRLARMMKTDDGLFKADTGPLYRDERDASFKLMYTAPVPADALELKAKEFVMYRFGCFLIDLLVTSAPTFSALAAGPPIRLLLANSLPVRQNPQVPSTRARCLYSFVLCVFCR
jgi:hypothetical protein